MKKFFLIIFVLAVSQVCLADEGLTEQQQLQIINDYLLAIGRTPLQPTTATSGELEQNPPIKCGTSAATNFVFSHHLLDRRLLQSAGLGAGDYRPTNLDLTYSSLSGYFLIHYTKTDSNAAWQPNVDSDGDGTPDYIETVGLIADSVYAKIIYDMGYPIPPSDGFYPSGGTSQYDIYVMKLPSSEYGLTYPDSVGLPGADSLKATSFLVLDNDYQNIQNYENRPYDIMRVTIAHEFFHAVQFGMDAYEGEGTGVTNYASRYWMEMSATWMEEQIYDQINDYYYYLPYFFAVPNKSIQRFAGGGDLHPYASVVLPIFLSEKFGQNIIKSIWSRCGMFGKGPTFLAAAQLAIDSISNHTQDWATAFQEFSIWNFFTGTRGQHTPNDIGYSERINYPEIPDSAQFYNGMEIIWKPVILSYKDYPVNVLANENTLAPEHNAAQYIRMDRVGWTRWRYWGCKNLNFDTVCVIKYSDSVCYPSTELSPDIFESKCSPQDQSCALQTGCSDTVLLRIDSTFGMYGVVDTTSPVWGLTMIKELIPDEASGISADSFLIDTLQVRVPIGYPAEFIMYVTDIPNPEEIKSVMYVLTPATPYYYKYSQNEILETGFIVDEEMDFDSALVNRQTAIFMPYPNPAVVSQMNGNPLRFKFQVATDSTSFPVIEDVKLVIDLFDVSGQHIRSIHEIPSGTPPRTGIYLAEWDMKNDGGKEVASGVYLGIARLYRNNQENEFLAEAKVKVLIVR